jgi:hypothetical protein
LGLRFLALTWLLFGLGWWWVVSVLRDSREEGKRWVTGFEFLQKGGKRGSGMQHLL